PSRAMSFDLHRDVTVDQKRLSQRELAIVALIGEGRTNKEIAISLGVAPETVKTHLKRIFRKLGTQSRAEAVVLARGAWAVTPIASQPSWFNLGLAAGQVA